MVERPQEYTIHTRIPAVLTDGDGERDPETYAYTYFFLMDILFSQPLQRADCLAPTYAHLYVHAHLYVYIYRRKFRSQTGENMDRKEVRRSEKRMIEKKEDPGARKVGKSRFTVFFK